MNDPRVERRRRLRYIAAVPIDFGNGFGTTQDVSEDGIRFVSQREFAVGQAIRFTLGFRNLTDGRRTTRLAGEGHVVRVKSDGVRAIVAIAVNGYSLPESA